MRALDVTLLCVFGVAIWIIGTLYYAHAGPAVFETTGRRFWLNFVAAPLASAVVCMTILHWLHIARADWAAAALLLAIPGMIGEAAVLSNLTTFMPNLQPASGCRYGAFLFVVYAAVLGMAEAVTLKTR